MSGACEQFSGTGVFIEGFLGLLINFIRSYCGLSLL